MINLLTRTYYTFYYGAAFAALFFLAILSFRELYEWYAYHQQIITIKDTFHSFHNIDQKIMQLKGQFNQRFMWSMVFLLNLYSISYFLIKGNKGMVLYNLLIFASLLATKLAWENAELITTWLQQFS